MAPPSARGPGGVGSEVDAPAALRRRLVAGTAATLAGNVWAIIVAVASLPLLLHGLGATAFGTYALLQAFSAVSGWVALADIGLGVATTREVARCRARVGGDASGMVGSALSLFAAMAILSGGLLVAVGSPLLPHLFSTPPDLVGPLRTAIALFSVQVAAELVIEGCEAALEGAQRVDLSRGVDAARRTLAAVAVVTTALATGRLDVTVAAGMAATLASVGAAAILLWRSGLRLGRPRVEHVRRLTSYGGRVSLLNAAGVLHRTMDRFIVGAALGPASVAVVEVATQVQNGALAVLSGTAYATVPAASVLHEADERSRLRRLVVRGTGYSLVATLPAVVLLAVIARPLVHVWVGDAYDEAARVLPLALAYVVMVAPLQIATNVLQGAGRASALIPASLAGVAVNLATSIVLVRSMGVAGVFVGTLIGTAVLTVPYLRHSLGVVDMPVRTFGADAVLPALPATLAVGVVAGATLAAPVGDRAHVAVALVAAVVTWAVVVLWVRPFRESLDVRLLVRHAAQPARDSGSPGRRSHLDAALGTGDAAFVAGPTSVSSSHPTLDGRGE